MKDISRRDFIKFCSAGTLGLMLKPSVFYGKTQDGTRSSDVIQCFHEDATTGSSINESVVQIMMDESIKTLTGTNHVGEAWKLVFPGITENSIISIKVNTINSYLPTHPAFVNCIINGLVQMPFGGPSFPRNNIIIWDRTTNELSQSGYTFYDGSDPNTVRCFGTNHAGVNYNYTMPFNVDGITSYPSRILTDMSDYVINAAVLKDHVMPQVTLTMKNHYGSVHNPGSLHGGGYLCNPEIPSLNQQIRDVIVPNNIQKIFIIDGLFGRVNWGPENPPNCIPNKLLMSFDTVACDWQGQVLINEERVALGYNTISAPHIPTAAAPPYNLGTTDVNLIEINNPTGASELTQSAASNGSVRVMPNPFRTKTTIVYSANKPSAVHIDLVDIAGRVEDRVFAGTLARGEHRIEYIIKKNLPAGNYFIRIHSNDSNILKKITILN